MVTTVISDNIWMDCSASETKNVLMLNRLCNVNHVHMKHLVTKRWLQIFWKIIGAKFSVTESDSLSKVPNISILCEMTGSKGQIGLYGPAFVYITVLLALETDILLYFLFSLDVLYVKYHTRSVLFVNSGHFEAKSSSFLFLIRVDPLVACVK